MDSPQKKKNPKKKIITAVSVIALVGAVGFIAALYNTKNKGEVSVGTLSGRSKEFLKKQQETPESELFAAQLNSTPDTTGASRLTAEGCYSLKTGMKVVNMHRSGDCTMTVFTENPRTTVVSFLRKGTFAVLDDDPGVKMRRLNTEQYKETAKTVKDREFTIFRLKDETKYESTAFSLADGALFAVSITSNTNEDLDARLLTVVQSVEFE